MSLPGFVISPLVGVLLTRQPLRRMMPLAAVVMAAGFAAATQATALWHLMLVYATTVPIGVTVLSAIGANALVANWFDRLRAAALGASQFGLSISGAFVAFLISWTLAMGGWRGTYGVFAVIALLTAPLLFATIVDRPADVGQHPDGDPPPDEPQPADAGKWTQADAKVWWAKFG